MMYTGGSRLPAHEINSGTPVIENIHYENIQCDYAKKNVIQIIGIPEMPINNVTLKNIQLSGKTGIEICDSKNIILDNLSISNKMGSFTEISFCDSIVLNNIEIISTDENKVPFKIKEVDNLSLENVKCNLKGNLVHVSGCSKSITIDSSIPEKKIIKK